MTVVQKEYFTVQSHVDIYPSDNSKPDPVYPEEPPFDNPTQIPPSLTHPHGLVGGELLLTDQPIATESLPMWFVNGLPKYRKIVRVLGATVNWVNQEDYVFSDPVPLNPGYRLFSNIVTNANIVMLTSTAPAIYRRVMRQVGKEGFVMMVNNYSSVKEFDITNESIREIQFFLRPWHSFVDSTKASPIDFVCELELLLVDDS
ncbi:hypothetical protein FACS189472_06280 [Alphaproteobacteria bacterium]|nr:hypothetical protein FACS189472_06280 [Alphaproteobacteria bacterium]